MSAARSAESDGMRSMNVLTCSTVGARLFFTGVNTFYILPFVNHSLGKGCSSVSVTMVCISNFPSRTATKIWDLEVLIVANQKGINHWKHIGSL